jgi:hypothetical protein
MRTSSLVSSLPCQLCVLTANSRIESWRPLTGVWREVGRGIAQSGFADQPLNSSFHSLGVVTLPPTFLAQVQDRCGYM